MKGPRYVSFVTPSACVQRAGSEANSFRKEPARWRLTRRSARRCSEGSLQTFLPYSASIQVEVQCFLLLEILGGSRKPVVNGAVKKLNRLWKENPGLVDQYLSIILHLEANQGYAIMLGLLGALLDFYLKTILMSKTKPHKHVLVREIARKPSNHEVGTIVHLCSAISCLLASVTLDLSQYALDIVKGLASAEGKLTVVAQKISILSGIGSCSHHAVSGASNQVLSGSMVELFIRFLQQEVHEGTLVHAISMLALWCGRFLTEVPQTLVEWFKKAFSLKACTSAVRHAYLQCNVLLQGAELLPLLVQTVEKAGAQSTQIPLVTEGVAAALLICRLSVADAQIENKLNSFWQLILDEKKQIFTSEKFLQQYYKALTAVLLSRSWSVRRLAQQTVRKLLSLPRGFKLACGLLEELKAVLISHKVLPPEALVTESGELSEQGKTYIPPRILQEALCVIACGPGMEGEPEEKEKLVLEMLLNKAYSFKEQIIELELKEEIKKKKGIKEEIQLTSKQKEMLTAQLEKESQMRKQLKELDTELESTLGLFDAVLKRNPPSLSQYIPALVSCFLPLLKSPLAAPRIKAPFLSLVSWTVASHVTLRMMKPECDLDESWCQEDLPTAVNRVISLLHKHTMVLLETPNDSEEKEELMVKVLQIITVHAQLRSAANNEDWLVDENGPELLPRTDMLLLLTKVIGTGSPRVQVLGSVALTALCASSSGEDGCAYAEQEEINVLLQALQSPCMNVRDAALRGLMELQMVLPTPDSDERNGMNLLRRLWVGRARALQPFTPEIFLEGDDPPIYLSPRLWTSMALELQSDICSILINDVIHHEQAVRQAGAEALSKGVEQYRSQTRDVMAKLMEIYQEKLYRPPPVLDALGRVILDSPPDQWEARCGIALALNKLSQHLESSQVKPLFQFFVPDALNDRHPEVRKCMLDAALSALNTHGKESVNSLLPVFEEFLKNAPNDASYDAVRQSVVILMGSLAKHLDKSDPKVKPIVAKLIAALSTPSQQVQESVASCLPPLVPAIKDDAGGMIQKLLQLLLESDKYAERKGAAYGLAGLVKGLGILSLKQQEMMAKLTDAIQDKKNFRRREGALFAFEMLCIMLGKLFEPYVVHVLPHLLLCFGDGNQYVREVSLSRLAVLEKQGAWLLQNFGWFCSDTRGSVKSSAALMEVTMWSKPSRGASQTMSGSSQQWFALKAVMSNLSAHGVKLVLPSLLAALEEDSWRTKAGSVELLGAMAYCAPKQLSSCLPNIVPKLTEVLTDSHVKVQKAGQQALRQIGSVIRNPEILAIAPVLLDALTDPSRKTQKCLQTLLDTKFVHFIDAPSLALIMPIVRTVSAKALGAMVKGMGESCFEDLLPWLMETLTYEQSSVDRSGAAQGLAEVMAGLGVEKLEKLMPDIVATASKVDIAPHVRDGYIMMFNYLPITFGEKFTPYVGPIIPCILKALADENEFVRDTALRAGQRIISMYAETAIALLLPQLEQGLFDDLWRIRYSSVQLLGDLLFHISGAIINALGVGRRNRVLAGLYMGRSDTQLAVRQASLHVWKIVVSNTPRTLREILPTLFGLLLGFLASTCADKRTIAARTLGDLVRKLGEKILPEIIPILEEGLRSEKSDKRQGVCIGLSEIMKSTSRDAVLCFSESLLPTVRKALCDPLEEVREAAAKTFEQLHSTIGYQALEDILPFLLKQLDCEETSEFALDGLKQLISPPVNTRVLAFLSTVAGDALTRHLGVILPAMMSALKEKLGTNDEQQAIEDEAGQRIIIEDLLDTTRSAEVGMRQAAAVILNIYCSKTKADYTAHLRNLVSGLIRLFNDTNSVGVTSILPMLREGVLTGNSDQKEEAAKALGLVIKLTSAEALKPSVVSITGPLIRILGDRFSWNVKLQTTFTKALQDPNRVVRLKAADALGKLIAIHAKVDPLFTELLNGIRTSEDSSIRQGAGAKVDAAVRKSIITILLSMLGHEEDATRMASAGCLAEMCAFLTDEELGGVLQNHLLADVSGIDWMVRHGRSLALSVAVNTAASRLCAPKYLNSIPIAIAGIRGMGFLMKHHIEANGGNLPPKLSNLFIKCLQNPSSDIKLIAEKMIWWANKAPLPPLDPPVAKPILKALLDNTKDKNTSVRAYSDQAIVNLLKMREGEEMLQSISKILDAASLELLNESCRRSLKKLANQADSVEQIDDTILT
ncbi:hypothetical protein Chor_013040 [Crotalus horridus]